MERTCQPNSPFPCASVIKQIPSYLKLVTDTNSEAQAAAGEDLASLAELCQAFEQATGWQLEVAAGPIPSSKSNLMWSAPVDPGVGDSPGHIRLISTEGSAAAASRISLEQAGHLAGAVGKLWAELLAIRHALWQREAELATGVPLVVRTDDEDGPPLGERLEGVLQGGAEAIGCQAAALYLLDPATTELKLRSSWGLPRRRLADPPRPLRGSLADLEALLGHAVVLSDDQLHNYWRVPEEGFQSCVCVPVSSPSMPLGTLWVFCREARDFSDAQTNIVEVVAGRLASDLERQVLVDEALSARDQTKQIAEAERSQQEQLPRIAPVIEGWQVAAKAYHSGSIGGTFYDWFALDDGSLAVLAGDAAQRGVNGALTATAMRAAARAFGAQRRPTPQLLEKVNSILWTGSAGNQTAGLFQAILDSRKSSCEFAAAGPLRVVAQRSADDVMALLGPTVPLGSQEEVRPSEVRRGMAPGELLIVYGTSFLSDCDERVLAALDGRLALALSPGLSLPANQLIDIADEILQSHPLADEADRIVLLVQRRPR